MEFSVSALLASFAEDKLVAPKALEKRLECATDRGLRQLQISLDALERAGLLEKERGKYRRVPEDGLVEGKLRCSSKGFCFAIQDDESAEDIYVRESQLSTAWNGDRVLVQVTKEGTRRRSPEGQVRLILERTNTSVLARVKKTDEGYRAVPLDDRLLFELDLQEDDIPLEKAVDNLAHVEILRYPLGQSPPIGRVTQILGSDAESAADTDIICCKYDLPREFPDEVNEAAEALSASFPRSMLKKRLDLRDALTVAFRPDESIEFCDDAITLLVTEDDHWQLGIHIADVSQYIKPGTSLDAEARKRSLSVHLSDVVIPMLPDAVARVCTLMPGEDRLALSVLLTLDDDGTVLGFEIHPTVIQVDYYLTYDQVQTLLETEADEETVSEDDQLPDEPVLAEMLRNLLEISQGIKTQRQQRGSFELNLPDTRFHYDDEGMIGAMVVPAALYARSIVLEFMLLANQVVASHLRALEVPALYRTQPAPNVESVQELIKLSENLGIELTLADEDMIQPGDYQNFVQQFSQFPAEKVLTYLLLETLKPASYSTTPRSHFGLALEDGYTHFTAPLRRYSDLLVHRVLHLIFDKGRDRRTSRAKERVNLHHSNCHEAVAWNVLPPNTHQELETEFSKISGQLSDREKVAQDAERDLEGLKKAGFMRDHTGEVFEGLITGVQSYGFFVEIEDMLVEGLVHVSSLKDDWYEYRPRHQKLVGRKNRRQFRLGDQVEVRVKGVDYYRQQIDLLAVGGGSQASDEEDFDSEEETAEED